MKRLLFLVTFVFTIANVWSQDRIQQIRQLYSSALQGVEHQRIEDDLPISKLELKVARIEAAIGLVHYEHELYRLLDENYSGFYRCKRQAGPYEPSHIEALLDREGNPIFIYTNETFVYNETSWRYEQRFYYNEDGTVCKVLRKATWADGSNRPLTDEDFVTNPEDIRQQIKVFYNNHVDDLIEEDFNDESEINDTQLEEPDPKLGQVWKAIGGDYQFWDSNSNTARLVEFNDEHSFSYNDTDYQSIIDKQSGQIQAFDGDELIFCGYLYNGGNAIGGNYKGQRIYLQGVGD